MRQFTAKTSHRSFAQILHWDFQSNLAQNSNFKFSPLGGWEFVCKFVSILKQITFAFKTRLFSANSPHQGFGQVLHWDFQSNPLQNLNFKLFPVGGWEFVCKFVSTLKQNFRVQTRLLSPKTPHKSFGQVLQ